MNFKNTTLVFLLIIIVSSGAVLQNKLYSSESHKTEIASIADTETGCVFKTVFEGEGIEKDFYLAIPQEVEAASKEGLEWLVTAQHNSGGFGAGSRARQDIMDPHQVPTDPATTAIVAMAILRDGSNLKAGPYSSQLMKATEHLLTCVEASHENDPNITELEGTQIQGKLGAYIDVILTSQYFTNLLEGSENDAILNERISDAVAKCVRKIESHQESDGGTRGSGWAGVLQSSYAVNALEAAQSVGFDVNSEALKNAKDYQRDNYDAESGSIATDKAAGVMLYSVSSSSRASAKDARKVRDIMEKAASEGKVEEKAEVNKENLERAGLEADEAADAIVSYKVYESAKIKAQADEILSGFGNNGGEEFLSFLQTGEGLIVNKDLEWQRWYRGTSDRLLQIQNEEGSWQGHHCITSPVFCTATALLILSVNNDIDQLVAQGAVD